MDYINMSGLETFGLSRDLIKNMTVKDILYSDDASEFPSVENNSGKKSKIFKNRFEARNYKKEPILLETLSSPIKLDNDRHGILVVARDVTERKKLEKEIILISERIRQQVSRDLHDDLNPHLIGIEALTRVLTQKLRQMNLPEYNEAEKIAALISKAITKTHRLARGLCPIDLESTGIQTPLMNLTKLLRSIYSIECKFEYDESVVIEDITLATNLYYIAQEAAFNAAKYSGGTVISITLKKAKDHLLLEIKDNGRGISSEHIKDNGQSSGMGLKIMKYRTEIIDASFMIKPDRPSGTVITVKIPLNILKGEGRINYGRRRSNREQEI
jgi:PAS domain S-box-containing protein